MEMISGQLSTANNKAASIISEPIVLVRFNWSEPLLIAAWFGLLAGLTEGVLTNFLRDVHGFTFRTSPQILWIAPLFDLILFLLMGVGLAAFLRIKGTLPGFLMAVGFFSWATLFGVLLLLGRINKIAALILSLGIAVQVARMLRGRELRAMSFFRKTIPVLIVVALLIGSAGAFWDRGRERYLVSRLPAPRPGAPNVLFITLDTLRADHLSSYGYQRATSPNLDRLARQGVIFDAAFANSSWTLPSHASMFTGYLPHRHKADWTEPLAKKYPTLAEALAGQGYLTAAFAANTDYVSPEWGLGRGFTHFEVHGSSLVEEGNSTVFGRQLSVILLPRLGYFDIPGRKRASQVNQEFFDWMDRTNGKPFFAFLNYFDIHDPYLTKSPYQTRFSNDVTHGELINSQFQSATFRSKPKLTEREVQAEIDGYDGCLAYLDDRLGELFAELSRRGLDKNTLVILTSDHGEAFGDHDLFGHGNGLYVDTLHVPLVFVWPGKVPPGTRVTQLVSLHNIPATVMELLGVKASPSFPGSSLARFWSGNPNKEEKEAVVSELSPGRFKAGTSTYPAAKGGLQSLLTEQWHFIISESGRTELYAWQEDPTETRDLSESPNGRIVVGELRQQLNTLLRSEGN